MSKNSRVNGFVVYVIYDFSDLQENSCIQGDIHR